MKTREERWGELIAKHALNWPAKDVNSKNIMHYLHSIIFDGWQDGFRECARIDDAARQGSEPLFVKSTDHAFDQSFDQEFDVRMKQTNQVPL